MSKYDRDEMHERRPGAIEAEYYGETRRLLMADPIIQDMAEGLRHVPIEDLCHKDGTPRFEFMVAALREYHARDGAVTSHLGGPAEALLALRLRGTEDK